MTMAGIHFSNTATTQKPLAGTVHFGDQVFIPDTLHPKIKTDELEQALKAAAQETGLGEDKVQLEVTGKFPKIRKVTIDTDTEGTLAVLKKAATRLGRAISFNTDPDLSSNKYQTAYPEGKEPQAIPGFVGEIIGLLLQQLDPNKKKTR